ncbi:hypothetical protein [Mycolicibacterium sp. 050158]|uniref:hypothetical protein n=1 Tax=Mycolicibacterium sp. 050158 TaxID=3090602 RepID=UPI00299E2BE9|nr:hypothetical protein [Mycolicibacterium sp. 050158]MDX1892468.1 hypothetical protein [Mycolicibacterium sp. 050158]
MTDPAPSALRIHAVAPPPDVRQRDGLPWFGEVWADVVDLAMEDAAAGRVSTRCSLEGVGRHDAARLLVRSGNGPLGVVDVPVSDGAVHLDELWCRLEDLRRGPETVGGPAKVGEAGMSATRGPGE